MSRTIQVSRTIPVLHLSHFGISSFYVILITVLYHYCADCHRENYFYVRGFSRKKSVWMEDFIHGEQLSVKGDVATKGFSERIWGTEAHG